MKNKSLRFHRRSIRLKNYDYSQAGMYFLTLVTYKRKRFFGEIKGKKMILSEAGKVAQECWLAIPEHFPNAVLHEFVIMPDHVHGIIELKKDQRADESLQGSENRRNEFGKIIPRSIGSIVKGFKIGVTKWFRSNTKEYKVWHRDYYERIVRDEEAYRRISAYIRRNPEKG
jgi:REP element-mobilizing transposase RayT